MPPAIRSGALSCIVRCVYHLPPEDILTNALPAPESTALYALTPEVHVMREALGLPSTCPMCQLGYDIFSPTCSKHGDMSTTWGACGDCGHLVTRARDADSPANGRQVWFHVAPTPYGYCKLAKGCAGAGAAPITEEQGAWLDAITKAMTPEQKNQVRELYLRLDPDRRDGFWNRCRFIWTIIRAVADETRGGR